MDTAGSKVTDIYITDWIALEHSAATGDFDRVYLQQIDNDACESVEKCHERSECTVYRSKSIDRVKCVSTKRIKKYKDVQTDSSILIGRNRQLYKVIDAKKMDEPIYGFFGYDVFYFMFQSVVNSSHIYVIFGSGSVHQTDQFNENADLRKFLTEFIESIYTKYSEKTIILCGHSAGCVLAIYTGMITQTNHKDFFESNVIIVGSAPFKYSNDDSSTFKCLPNVKIFASCITYTDIKKIIDEYNIDIDISNNSVIVDEVIYDGVCKYNYDPITYITITYDIIDIANYTRIELKYLIDIISSSIHEKSTQEDLALRKNRYIQLMHNWNIYYDILTSVYGNGLTWDGMLTGSNSGGENSQTHTKTRRRITHIKPSSLNKRKYTSRSRRYSMRKMYKQSSKFRKRHSLR